MNPLPEDVHSLLPDGAPIASRLGAASPPIAEVLSRSLEKRPLSENDLLALLGTRDGDLAALVAVADEVRREDVGDVVTYVVNRNINFTNVCYVGCRFCAFAQRKTDADAYSLSYVRKF